MQGEEIKQLLEKTMNAEVIIEGEGCNFQVTVISNHFENLPPIKRQQMVYAQLGDLIKSGIIHAVTMKTMTPDERNNSQ